MNTLIEKPTVTLITLVPPVKKKLTDMQKKRRGEILLYDNVSKLAEGMFSDMFLNLLSKRSMPASVEIARSQATQDAEAAARYAFTAAAKFFEHKENVKGAFVSEE